MDIRRQLIYADNCCAQLQETLAAYPQAVDQPFETLAAFKSIHQLVAHLIGAEERWVVQRLCGQPVDSRYESRAAETIDGLFTDWEAIRVKTRAFVESADAYTLQSPIAFSLPQWGYEGQMTVEETIFHVFNHQTFHIGQISMALQQKQIDPPNFDYTFLRE